MLNAGWEAIPDFSIQISERPITIYFGVKFSVQWSAVISKIKIWVLTNKYYIDIQ